MRGALVGIPRSSLLMYDSCSTGDQEVQMPQRVSRTPGISHYPSRCTCQYWPNRTNTCWLVPDQQADTCLHVAWCHWLSLAWRNLSKCHLDCSWMTWRGRMELQGCLIYLMLYLSGILPWLMKTFPFLMTTFLSNPYVLQTSLHLWVLVFKHEGPCTFL